MKEKLATTASIYTKGISMKTQSDTYGYITGSGRFIETGRTLKGAKIAATRAGSVNVGYRSYITNMFNHVAMKVAGIWS